MIPKLHPILIIIGACIITAAISIGLHYLQRPQPELPISPSPIIESDPAAESTSAEEMPDMPEDINPQNESTYEENPTVPIVMMEASEP
jgi:hypothetical protein